MHAALVYETPEDFLAETSAYVSRARAAGRPVLVAVPEPRLRMLRDRLGPTAEAQVSFVDMGTEGRNPGRIIPGVLRPFVEEHRGHHPAIIGEPVWPGRSRRNGPPGCNMRR